MNGTYLRGEVYWLEAGHITYGSGVWMDKNRPVVIISSNEGNVLLETVEVLFLTTQGPGGRELVFTWLTKPKKSWINCNQIFNVSKDFLKSYVGQLSPDEMTHVDKVLRETLSLGRNENSAEKARFELAITSRDEIIKTKDEELRVQGERLSAYEADIKRLNEEIESLKLDMQDLSDNHRYEVDLWQRMYSKAVDSVVTMQLERDVLRRTELRCGNVDKPVVAAVVEEPPVKVEEPQKLDEPKPEVEEKPKKPRKPRKKKEPAPEQVTLVEEPPKPKKINVNTATAKELADLVGMSPTVAYCVTGYRKKHGDYKSLEELVNVQRFSEGMLAKYRDKMEV